MIEVSELVLSLWHAIIYASEYMFKWFHDHFQGNILVIVVRSVFPILDVALDSIECFTIKAKEFYTFLKKTLESFSWRHRTIEENRIKCGDIVCLPDKDPEPVTRAFEVNNFKFLYEFTHEGIGEASLVKGLPLSELPQRNWVLQIFDKLDIVIINKLMIPTDPWSLLQLLFSAVFHVSGKLSTDPRLFGNHREMGIRIMKITRNLLQSNHTFADFEVFSSWGSGLKPFKHLFQSIPLPQIAKMERFLGDDIFGWYRVAGPNPMRITLCKKSDTTETQTQLKDLDKDLEELNALLQKIDGFGGDNVDSMIEERRLYFVDYGDFGGIGTGQFKYDGKGELLREPKSKMSHLYAPRAFFGVKSSDKDKEVKRPWPLAIRAGQERDKFDLLTPNANRLTWIAAKIVVQVADAFAHEILYHLGQTHLLIEIFVCATHRNLHERHPMFKLLTPHFNGTCFINWLAVGTLINNGGPIDEIVGADIEKVREIAGEHIRGFKFNEGMLYSDLESRGFSDCNKATITFPYAEDAKQVWKAIHRFVETYIGSYYYSDEDVKQDNELKSWAAEISCPTKGALKDFGDGEGKIESKEQLVKAVTMIIFSASVQHAAVNFPQGAYMEYAPAMALAGYDTPPTTGEIYSSTQELVNAMLPPIDKAHSQLDTTFLLSSVYYTRLGDYGDHFKGVRNDSVSDGLRTFKKELQAISESIRKRNWTLANEARLPTYTYCLPENIPQSINI